MLLDTHKITAIKTHTASLSCTFKYLLYLTFPPCNHLSSVHFILNCFICPNLTNKKSLTWTKMVLYLFPFYQYLNNSLFTDLHVITFIQFLTCKLLLILFFTFPFKITFLFNFYFCYHSKMVKIIDGSVFADNRSLSAWMFHKVYIAPFVFTLWLKDGNPRLTAASATGLQHPQVKQPLWIREAKAAGAGWFKSCCKCN